MALSLSCEGFFETNGTEMFFEDTTGTYNATSNTGGYGAPNPTTNSVTNVQIKCNWVSAGAIITYDFIVSSNVITSATMTDNEGNVANILSSISTVFPMTSSNPFPLASDFDQDVVLPDLEDGQFIITYKVVGNSNGAYTYTTSTTYFRTTDLCCCLQELRLTADPTCDCGDVQAQVNRVEYWLTNAWCAIDAGKPNDVALGYFTKAQEVCDNDCCGDC